jgi:hypothetical protein
VPVFYLLIIDPPLMIEKLSFSISSSSSFDSVIYLFLSVQAIYISYVTDLFIIESPLMKTRRFPNINIIYESTATQSS